VAVLLDDLTGLVDDEGGADQTLADLPVQLLLPEGAETGRQFVVFVGEKIEGEMLLFLKPLVAIRGVRADANDVVTGLPELGVALAEVTRLGGAAGARRP